MFVSQTMHLKRSPAVKLFLALIGLGMTLLAGPAEDLYLAADKSEAGLVAMAESLPPALPPSGKGKATLSPVALEALILAFQEVPFTQDLSLDSKASAAKALNAIRKKYALPKMDAMLPRLLANPSPSVRAKAVEMNGGGLFGASPQTLQAVAGLLESEQDSGVLYALIRAFANEGGRNPAVGAFLVRCLDNPEPLVRRWVVLQSCSSWNSQTQGFTEKLAERMNTEPDVEVRKAILAYAGKLGREELVPAYEAALQSTTDQQLLTPALAGLTAMWWGYPLYNFASEAAYRLTLKFLNEFRPETLESSAFAMIRPLSSIPSGPNKKFEAWKAKATWYDSAEVRTAIQPFFTTPTYPAPVRSAALMALFAHGATKEELTTLVDQLAAAGEAEGALNGFRTAIEKMK